MSLSLLNVLESVKTDNLIIVINDSSTFKRKLAHNLTSLFIVYKFSNYLKFNPPNGRKKLEKKFKTEKLNNGKILKVRLCSSFRFGKKKTLIYGSVAQDEMCRNSCS